MEIKKCQGITHLGIFIKCYLLLSIECCVTVAGSPTITSAQQVSPGTTIRVRWSPPTEEATVTGYRVVYTSSGSPSSSGSQTLDPTATNIDITDLINDGRAYTITVEAESDHFPGVSDDRTVPLPGELMIH